MDVNRKLDYSKYRQIKYELINYVIKHKVIFNQDTVITALKSAKIYRDPDFVHFLFKLNNKTS